MTSHPSIPPADHAWRHWSAHLVFWLVCFLGLALDLYSKHWAWAKFYNGDFAPQDEVIIPGFLQLTAVPNKGALFGLGQGLVLFFIVASIAAIGVVVYLFARSSCRQWWLHLASGLILAGAIGNLFDRWKFGFVRDFIHVYSKVNVGGWEFPLWRYIFNVADMMLVIGVGILLIYWYVIPWFRRPKIQEPEPTIAQISASPVAEAMNAHCPSEQPPTP